MRIVGVSIFFTINGFKSLIGKIKEVDFQRLVNKMGVDLNNASKSINTFSLGFAEKGDKFSESIANFGNKLSKDPFGTLKQSLLGVSSGIDKAEAGIMGIPGAIGGAVVNQFKPLGAAAKEAGKGLMDSTKALGQKLLGPVYPLIVGLSRFLMSLLFAAGTIIFTAIKG